MIDEDAIRQRWEAVGCKLDERGRRLFAAGEVRTAGWGGLAVVSKITGLARSTVNRGRMISTPNGCRRGAFAAPGAGVARFAKTIRGSSLHSSAWVAPATLGDPMRRLIWVSKSVERPLSVAAPTRL